jgi:uncharacterized protein (DUF2141 family)
MMMKVRDRQARCNFEDIPPGTYALAVIHDENKDGKLEATGWGAPRKATVFQTTQKPCSARLRFLAPAFSTTGKIRS